ncbi:sugar-binding protein [Paenibacillus sacheonensis]|uniref:Carbohydrate-binding domain-containing protein n=1 Tax=Paenibacillus sacheonensis TaxID=742054 RepID=A0A7X4YRF2_9BACL|nr:sugar-binding protein [Paenibacillus sacheonensis]MBM7565021.1 hypothetical protein [Paenibacillus sacheonensis]NBC70194.1 hypothetical protein [Paenibacillus sacheonensis]
MGGKFKWLKTLSLMSLLLGSANGLIAAGEASAAAGDITGSSVAFDGTGKFKDTLDTLDNVFMKSGVNAASGGVTGPGDLYYYAGSTSFKGVAIDVNAFKWSLKYTAADDLKVFEAEYDSGSGTFTDGDEVMMVRKQKPDLLTSRDQLKASYVSGPVPAGTKYLHIRLPQAGFFNNSEFGNFSLDNVTLTSMASSAASNDYIVDTLASFDKLAAGAVTSNLHAVANVDWDVQTFSNLTNVERLDATLEDKGLTYEVPAGKEAKSVYAEGYFNFLPSKYFEVWASPDGATYTNATQSSSYHKPAVPYDSNWVPTSVDVGSLPAGTRFVQVRLPAFTSGELYGMKHPKMTRVAIGYGDPADDTGPVETPGQTTIKQAAGAISINGAVELDDNGKPTGGWQGANAITLTGITDTNGDDHGAKVYFSYDADNLYVGAVIADPTPMINENTGTNLWGGDNLELFFGTEDTDYSQFPDKKNTMLASDVQVVISGSISNGPQSYVYRNSNFSFPTIPLAGMKSADGKSYTLEAAIPLSELGITNPWDNKRILLNAVLNDGSSSGRGQWGWTTTGETLKKNRGQWGKADLEAGSAPVQDITADVIVDENTNRITVAGQRADGSSKDVTLLVTDPNGAITYIDQAPSDSQGHYSFTFPITGSAYASGLYTVSVGGDDIARATSATFDFTPGEPGSENNGEPRGTLSGPASAPAGGAIGLEAGFLGGGDASYNVMQAVIHYDKDTLDFAVDSEHPSRLASGVVTSAVSGLNVLDAAIKPAQGEIMVLLGSTVPNFAAQGRLFTLHATAKAGAAAGDTTVSMREFQLSSETDLITAADSSATIRLTAADHSALAAAIADAQQTHDEAVEGSATGQYPAGAKAALQAAIDAAQAVADNASATREEIADAAAALQAAVDTFQGSVNVPVVDADKTALANAIAAAQSTYDAAVEGSKVGQYPQAAKSALQAAISQANAVLNNAGAAQAAVDQAVTALQSAVGTFKGQLVTLVPGETRITIRDLSILAKYFGMTSSDPNWSAIEKADLFDEGEITLRSLAAIAQMILDDWLNE